MVLSDSTESASHVAVLAFPFGTHAAPLHALTRALAAAAPAVYFSFLSSADSNAALPQGDGAPPNLTIYDVRDGLPDGFTVDLKNPEEEVELFMEVTPGNFREGMEAAVRGRGGAKITCVLSDAFLWIASDLAEELGPEVSWVTLWTGGPRSLSAHIYTDDLRTIVGTGDEAVLGKADDDIGFLPGMSAVRVRDLPEGVVAGNLGSVFARLLHRMGQELHRAAAVAVNTFEGLDDAINDDHRRMFKACHLVGPLNLLSAPTPTPEPEADLSGCLAWLDGQPRQAVAYISFGTLMSPPPQELAELAAGLEASGAPFLWALKEKHHAFLPAGFLERMKGRGLVVAWAPQRRVLEHPAAGAFVTHCGWNSVMESVAGGVPMVCRPFLGDQRLNARSISAIWGVGVEIDGGRLTQEGVVAALSAVLGSEKGRGMREKISRLREAAAAAVQPGGSSAESLRELVRVVSRRGSIEVSLTI